MRSIAPPGTGLMPSSPVGAILGVVTAMTTDLLWAVDGSHDIGDVANGRPNNIYASGALTADGTIIAGGLLFAGYGVSARGGLLTLDYDLEAVPATVVAAYGIYNVDDTALSIRSTRADGAGNISNAIIADVDNATINATHKILTIGWINNADAYTEAAYFEGNGDLVAVGTISGNALVSATTATLGTNLLWAGDGGGDIGAVAASRPANIYATTAITAGGTISGNALASTTTVTATTGFIAGALGLVNDATGESLVISGLRTDSAGNVSVRIAADVNNATITNTHKILSIGWINNVDAYTEKVYVRGNGVVYAAGIQATATINGNPVTSSGAITFRNGLCSFNLDAFAGAGSGVSNYGMYNTNTGHSISYRSIRADGAGNVAIVLCADVDNATINATYKILTIGWIDNGDAWNETAYFEGNGDLVITGNLTADNVNDASIAIIIDGGGAEIAVGVHADLEIPFDCTVTAVTLLADQVGSIVVDIWKDTYANYPPTNADTITAAAPPTIGAANKAQSGIAGWTVAFAKGETLRYNVDSVTDIERVLVHLQVTKP